MVYCRQRASPELKLTCARAFDYYLKQKNGLTAAVWPIGLELQLELEGLFVRRLDVMPLRKREN